MTYYMSMHVKSTLGSNLRAQHVLTDVRARSLSAIACSTSAPVEAREVEPRRLVLHEISQDLTDHRGELEAVARARTRDQHVFPLRMMVDQEMPVRHVGVQAHRRASVAAIGRRHEAAERGADVVDLRLCDVTAYRLCSRRLTAVMERHLDS